ncbi:MAG: hypothetical protein IJS14_06540 [Lentisphaeria bacterium]|nr:hypothetical protein [Lentisphaeria bacterium]
MKKQSVMLFLLSAVLSLGAVAADKLAIAEPVNKGGMNPQEIEAVWSMLEATVDGGFELISRGALKSMMTEIGLTTSSDLVNLNSTQKARLGEVKTVKYLLVPTVSKFGTRINFSLIMVDASTGSIDPEKKASETFSSLDEMADKLKDTLAEIGLGTAVKKRGISAVLAPVIKLADAPPFLADEFNTGLEEALLNGGIRLHNLQSVGNILRKNNIGSLAEVEPAMYRRIGELLRVDYLIQARIDRFSCVVKKVYVEVTRKYTTSCIGNIAGDIRIISAQTGEVAASFRFQKRVDFDDIDDDTDDWTPRDYCHYLIEKSLPLVSKKAIAKLKK